jgi:hypothetical protein
LQRQQAPNWELAQEQGSDITRLNGGFAAENHRANHTDMCTARASSRLGGRQARVGDDQARHFDPYQWWFRVGPNPLLEARISSLGRLCNIVCFNSPSINVYCVLHRLGAARLLIWVSSGCLDGATGGTESVRSTAANNSGYGMSTSGGRGTAEWAIWRCNSVQGLAEWVQLTGSSFIIPWPAW